MAASLFDAGGADPTVFVKHHQYQHLAFQAVGDSFRRVELAGGV